MLGCDEGGATAACRADCTQETSFISVWRTTSMNPLPLRDGFNYNFTVDWGDGSSSEVNVLSIHTYATADYTITITGTMETIYSDKDKLLSIPNLGDVGWLFPWLCQSPTSRLFFAWSVIAGFSVLIFLVKRDGDGYMFFFRATSASPTSNWDTSSVTNMHAMFYSATSANPETRKSVTKMNRMFYDRSALIPAMLALCMACFIDFNPIRYLKFTSERDFR